MQGRATQSCCWRTCCAGPESCSRVMPGWPAAAASMLFVHLGPDLDPYAAAALAGVPYDDTIPMLDELHADGLLAEPLPAATGCTTSFTSAPAASQKKTTSPVSADHPVGRLPGYFHRTAARTGTRLARQGRPASCQ